MNKPKTVLEIVLKYEEDVKKANLEYSGTELLHKLEEIYAENFIPVDSLLQVLQEGKAYQIVTIQHPDYPDITAILNVWFVEKDIVLGGLGWFEYNDYEEMHREIKRKPNTCPKCGKGNPYHYDFDRTRCRCSDPKCRHKWTEAKKQ